MSQNNETQNNNNPLTQNINPPTRIPHLTITVPPHTNLRHSSCLQNLPPSNQLDHTAAFISEYTTVQDTHDLFPTDICLKEFLYSIDDVLAALSDGSLAPSIDADNEPTWAQAMASDEHEYWIAGGCDELKSLEDLKVFILVP
jgi:hypothetical protein